MLLKEKFAAKLPAWRSEIKSLLTESSDFKVSDVTVAQAYGGMRGVKAMICDTSEVPPDKGLLIRGIPIAKLTDKLPEEIFFLLCTGELPNAKETKDLQAEYAKRAKVPQYVWDVLKAMPKDSHPMCMLNTGILVMERESKFRARYTEGMKKDEYWDPMMEDSLDLLAKLPVLAAGVYRIRFGKGNPIPYDPKLDWGGNYTKMLGIPDPTGKFADFIRLYLTLHCDHEGGNVSAHTSHCVGSALSDAYYAVSAGLNGLAGPLHGLANQECLDWILKTVEKFGRAPSAEEIKKYAWETLNSGKVIPGYGHAVLRITDPRFDAFLAFGRKFCMDSPVVQTVSIVFDVVPGVLTEQGKAKDPWPNVDAGSGAMLYYYGLTEFSYYTVLFSVSRSMGLCAQLIVNRALGIPIERPKSIPTSWVKKQIAAAKK